MQYKAVIFDLYNTLMDDARGLEERERYRIDTIYSILEKSNYPVLHSEVAEKYGQTILRMGEVHATGLAFHPFDQVTYLLHSLKIDDIVIHKKVYDALISAVLQITPQLMPNAKKALSYLKENDKKVGLISNTARTPGHALRFLLKELGIEPYFDSLIFSDEVGFLKPEKVIFDLSLAQLGVNAEDAIFVGDLKRVDFDGAVTAGLHAHLFNKEKDNLYELAVEYCGGFYE